MNDNLGCLIAIIITITLMMFAYTSSNNATECLFAQDVITCVQVVKGVNK